MESFYPYFLIVHLMCAIIFLGYIFCDVIFLNLVRKKLDNETANNVSSIISARSKFMPLCFVVLLVSGGAMLLCCAWSWNLDCFASKISFLLRRENAKI